MKETSRSQWCIRQLWQGDAAALARFYNGLSEASRTTFRPLGWQTTVAACAKTIDGNLSGQKYDLVATLGVNSNGSKLGVAPEIVGWGFVWDVESERPNLGLGIADAYHGRGLGGTLIDRVLKDVAKAGLRRVYLIVVQDNHVAYRLYESRGFVRYGEMVGDDGLAYYRMVAELG